MDYLILSAISLGFVLGFKHATDADHVAAVSTIVSERRGLLASAMVGLSWGIGHSITLFLISVPVLIFRLSVPDNLGPIAEAGVGVVLVILGFQTLLEIRRKRIHVHPHNHETGAHVHFHPHQVGDAHEHEHRFALRPKSILIGLFQGTAGSAALMLVVLTTLESPLAGILYVAAYDLAVILGIVIFSFAIGLPFTLTSSHLPLFNKALKLTTAVVSIVIGVLLAWQATLGAGLG
ncbi:MAG: urease accessory protein UreH [Chloroflexi bacterium]|nr:urease accessory protein UreH [Chloroflexota bacterium]